MVSFKDMKRNSTAQFDKLNKELEKINQSFDNTDNRLWNCVRDKAGNGYAVIRFLPAPEVDGEDGMPFVRLWTHGFKGPGGWLIEDSPTTIGKDCPISEWNTTLWNQGEGSEGRKRVSGTGKDNPGTKRQLNYYSNIYVVKDAANPENEGKVFLFRYGKKIFDKLNDAMHPQFEGEDAVNPFDLWSGANFKLKIRQVEGYANYDKSEFDAPGPLLDDDDELEKIWKQCHSLAEFNAPSRFKTYDQLKARLDKVLGNTPSATPQEKQKVQEEAPEPNYRESEPKKVDTADLSDSGDDDEAAFFRGLIDDD